MNISLTKKQEKYIAAEIALAYFQNASKLFCDALQLHDIYRHKLVVDLYTKIEKRNK